MSDSYLLLYKERLIIGIRRLGAALCTLVLFALAVPALRLPAAIAAPMAAPASPLCVATDLAVAPIVSTGGMGHLGILFGIYNHSNHACSLWGYPRIQLLNSHFAPVPTYISHGPGYLGGKQPRRDVRFAPRHHGVCFVKWVQVPSTGDRCPFASAVRVITHGDFRPTLVRLGQARINACGGRLIVPPVEPTRFAA